MSKTRVLMHGAGAIAATVAVSWLQIKPLGVLFIILFVFWMYKTRCTASIEIITPPDFHASALRVYEQFSKLRQDKPGIFCLITCGFLGIMAIVGHILSGSYFVLIGLTISGLVSTKYNFRIVKVPKTQSYSWTEAVDHDVDEFLPEVNETNLFVLQRASDQAIIPSQPGDDDEKSDEIPSELLIPDSIPEIDEKSESSSDDELLIKAPVADTKAIEFKKGYFKKDSSISTSSSSDEESLSKGLNFQDYSLVDSRENSRTQPVMSSSFSTAISPLSLVSGFVSWSAGTQSKTSAAVLPLEHEESPNRQIMDTSDDSDFELINPDDVNNP